MFFFCTKLTGTFIYLFLANEWEQKHEKNAAEIEHHKPHIPKHHKEEEDAGAGFFGFDTKLPSGNKPEKQPPTNHDDDNEAFDNCTT